MRSAVFSVQNPCPRQEDCPGDDVQLRCLNKAGPTRARLPEPADGRARSPDPTVPENVHLESSWLEYGVLPSK